MAVRAENEHLRWAQLAGCPSRPPVRVRLLSDFIKSNIPHHLWEASSRRRQHSLTHSPAVHFTPADTSPASMGSHWNYIWMITASHNQGCLRYFLPPLRRSRRGSSATSTSTAGRKSASQPRAKAWSTSSPRCSNSSSGRGTTPSSYTAGIHAQPSQTHTIHHDSG